MQKHKDSHMDHGFTQAQWDYIFAKYSDKKEFFIDTFELPEGLGSVTNELYGPSAGDLPMREPMVSDDGVDMIFHATRGERAWPSRMVRLPKRPTRFVRVIAGPHEETCPKCGGTGYYTNPFAWHSYGDPEEQHPCEKIRKYDCILYTAYGVASLDMATSPKEPGDIIMQLSRAIDAVEEAQSTLRTALGPERISCSEAVDRAIVARDKIAAALRVSKAFWADHALATEAAE